MADAKKITRRSFLSILGVTGVVLSTQCIIPNIKSHSRYNFPQHTNSKNTFFDTLKKTNTFLYIDVYGGNTPKNLERAQQTWKSIQKAKTKRPIQYALETDICWANDNGKPLFYCYHPTNMQYITGWSFPDSAKDVAKMEREGKVLLLDQLLEQRDSMYLCLDIKGGGGSREWALGTLTEKIAHQSNTWLYSYDSATLATIASVNPHQPLGTRVWKYYGDGTARYFPYVSETDGKFSIDSLPVECITITATSNTEKNLRELTKRMAQQNRHVVFGTLKEDTAQFKLAYEIAAGAYMHKLRFEEVKQLL